VGVSAPLTEGWKYRFFIGYNELINDSMRTMEQITIQVKNKQKARALIRFLKALDFIEEVTAQEISLSQPGKVSDHEFFALAGLWAGRDVTLDSIRQKVRLTRA
jgi:hypothetical protein